MEGMNGNGSIPAALLERIEKLEAENKSHHETFAKLVQSGMMDTARIAALEELVKDLAMQSLGDTPETADLLKRLNQYFTRKLAEIKKFKP